MTRTRRRLLIAVAAFVVLVIGMAVALVVAAGPIARGIAVEAARGHGVELETDHVDLGWGWIRLRGARLSLESVPGIRATVERATVDFDGLSPSRVEARGVSVTMSGSAADFVVDLGTWAKRHPDAVKFPVVAEGVSVVWREREGQAPWLTLDQGFIAPQSGGARLTADKANVLDLPVGPVGAVWASDNATVTFGFGNSDPNAALASMVVDRNASTATVTLRPVKLADLAKPLGVKLPIDGNVVLDGKATLSLASVSADSEVTGNLSAKLKGYVPPHPRELDGIVFGDVTSFETKLRLSSDRRKVVLENSRVAAGAFVLTGGGTIDRRQDHGLVAMKMAGDIPCTALAKSAAAARIGGALGALLGDAAKRALAGSVRVSVAVEADTRELDRSKVTHDVGIGCTLRIP